VTLPTLPLPIAVLAAIDGLTIGLLGLGLVLTYRASRVLNFAQGAAGALAATVTAVAVIRWHVPYPLAIALALLVGGATGAVTEAVVVRRLEKSPRLVVLVATLGLAQLFAFAAALLPTNGLGSAAFPLPALVTVRVGGLTLTMRHLLVLATVPLAVLALELLLRRTALGLGSRAAADNPDAAALAGVPVRRVSLTVWTIGGVLAAVAAVLYAPSEPLTSLQTSPLGPGLVLRGLAAAMLGGLGSTTGVLTAGVGLGVLEQLLRYNYPGSGTSEVGLFAVVLISLLVRRGLRDAFRGGESGSWQASGGVPELPDSLRALPRVQLMRRGSGLAVVAAAALLPVLASNSTMVLATTIVLFAAAGLSLVVLTGFAGQISLGQFAFVEVGALVGGRMHQLGYPGWVAVLYASAAGALVACLVGLPALRVRGLFLAVTTLAFAVAATLWLPAQAWLVATIDGRDSQRIPRPTVFGVSLASELRYYWLCLAFLIAAVAVVRRVRVTGVGRVLLAVRDNETQAAGLGISPRRAKLTAFVLAGVLASTAGYLYGGLLGTFGTQTDRIFGPQLGLELVALVVFGGITTPMGAVVGACWVEGLRYLVAPLLPAAIGGQVAALAGGAGLLLAVLVFPQGLAAVLVSRGHALLARFAGQHAREAGNAAAGSAAPEAPAGTARLPAREHSRVRGPVPALHAEDITVRFDGNTVLDGVSITLASGEMLGLVGPNGAGKTTLFDALTGQVPSTGRVLLDGLDIGRLRPEQRARIGLVRTAQSARLFEALTVRECLAVALEATTPTEVVPALLGLPPGRAAERRARARADDLVGLLGLAAVAGRRIGELSTGTRRIVELGTVIALQATVVLLDEPTAGVAQREVEAMAGVLREVRDHLDASMIIIEHDLPLLTGLVDRTQVLAAGHTLAVGPPSEVAVNPTVIAAYLGTDERVVRRSGTAAATSDPHANPRRPRARRGADTKVEV